MKENTTKTIKDQVMANQPPQIHTIGCRKWQMREREARKAKMAKRKKKENRSRAKIQMRSVGPLLICH